MNMGLFLISKRRLLVEIELNIRKSGVGVLNWFLGANNIINIVLKVRDVEYLFRIERSSDPNILTDDVQINSFLTSDRQVLDYVDSDILIDHSQEQEEVPMDIPSFNDLWGSNQY